MSSTSHDQVPGNKRLIFNPFRLWRGLALLTFLAAPAASRAQAPSPADFGWKNQEAKGIRPLLVILIEDPTKNPLVHKAQDYDRLLFGDNRNYLNMARYIASMSGGHFSYGKAGVVGPYGVALTDKKGISRSSDDIRADAIREAAKKDVDFSRFDTNKDKIVSTKELSILVIDNGNDIGAMTDGGGNVVLAAQKVRVQSAVCGVAQRESFMTMCHELMHTLGGLDIYGWQARGMINVKISTFGPTSIADARETYYLDPWHRMQFGWVQPQIRDMRVAGSIELGVPQVVENDNGMAPRPLILYDSQKGPKEFFMLEYRNATAGRKVHHDKDVASNGLTIWHVQHGADKKPFLMNYEVKPDPKMQIWTVYNRGAPDWNQGGNRLYTQADGEIALRWMDRGDSGIRVKVNGPAKGDYLPVSWSLTLKRTGAAVVQGADGNLDAVVREGNELFPYFMTPGKPWIRVAVPITKKATGPGAIAVNKNRNFEVVALEGKELVHYWAVPGKPYNRGDVITNKASGPGSIICSSSGNLDVLAQEGNEIAHYYYFKGKWNRGGVISKKATGPGAIAQERGGNLNAVVLEGKELVHYWAKPGQAFNRGSVLTNKATGPGSIVGNKFGTLDVVVQEGANLAHYWAKEGQGFKFGSIINNKTTTVGIGAVCQSRNGNLDLLLIEANQLIHYWAAPGKGFNRASAF